MMIIRAIAGLSTVSFLRKGCRFNPYRKTKKELMSQQHPFTEEEIKAIANLKRAFTKCKKLKLKFCGMDQSMYVCNIRAYDLAHKNRSDNNADYNEVAFALQNNYSGADILISGDPYIESGGW